MAGQVRVVGALAILATEAGGDAYVYRGGVVDEAAFTAESVKHNLAVGVLEKVKPAPSVTAKAKADAEAKAKADAEAAEAVAKAEAEAAAKAAAEAAATKAK